MPGLDSKFWPVLRSWPGLKFGLYKHLRLQFYLYTFFTHLMNGIDFIYWFILNTYKKKKKIRQDGFKSSSDTCSSFETYIWLQEWVIGFSRFWYSLFNKFLKYLKNVILLLYYIKARFFLVYLIKSHCSQDRTISISNTCMRKKWQIPIGLF